MRQENEYGARVKLVIFKDINPCTKKILKKKTQNNGQLYRIKELKEYCIS